MTNEARAQLGLESISLNGRPVSIELMDRADSVLVAMTPEFDPWEEPLDNVVHVGPLFEEGSERACVGIALALGRR